MFRNEIDKIMTKTARFLTFLLFPTFALSVFGQSAELKKWERQAQRVNITRDDWGIAHVVGKTDADAVFGAIYAQAEDDFNRVETNYINAMGRLAEAEGEAAIWQDLRMKLFIDPADIKAKYDSSPAWLKELMKAWADGLNYYLATHPAVKPRVITRFEPWMPLTFSEGSIGGDIETTNLQRLQEFYGEESTAELKMDVREPEPRGSNGIAIAPKNTKNGNALLLINPHTSFFFRSELQMTSGEGLNAYGASTWGQFFIYQGFNENCGWMHTSSAADAIDEFAETIITKNGQYFYKYGKEERAVSTSTIKVPYKTATGTAERTFTVYRTQHGPVIRKAPDGKWITISLMQEPVKALMQSYGRTKAKNYNEFKQIMDLHANSSNNTIYADRSGNIAYFHVNFIPRRDPKFDWTKPVDGSDPATDWKGLLTMEESPNLFNPASGWLYNANDWPWEAAGTSSRMQAQFPKYVDNGVQSSRGRHAVRVLEGKRDFTLDSLRDAAYDSYLTWFDKPLPALLKAWDQSSDKDLKAKTADQIAMLKQWDQRWGVNSIPTSLAVFWGEEIQKTVRIEAPRVSTAVPENIALKATGKQMLEALVAASDRLTTNFGTWRTPWGDINRFQRLTGDIRHPFSDSGPSIPVAFTSAVWGSLASFGAAPYRGSKKIYGTSGNSFVAVVEFGKNVRAKAVTAGGESGHPESPHFNDQAERYASGNLREVYFYPEQLRGHVEKKYRPGIAEKK
jgi:acyl-homoserine-lactone acylase